MNKVEHTFKSCFLRKRLLKLFFFYIKIHKHMNYNEKKTPPNTTLYKSNQSYFQ